MAILINLRLKLKLKLTKIGMYVEIIIILSY
jgi:hypothetical protein